MSSGGKVDSPTESDRSDDFGTFMAVKFVSLLIFCFAVDESRAKSKGRKRASRRKGSGSDSESASSVVPAAETSSRDRFRGLPIKTEPPIGRFTGGFRSLTREQPETDSGRSLGGRTWSLRTTCRL